MVSDSYGSSFIDSWPKLWIVRNFLPFLWWIFQTFSVRSLCSNDTMGRFFNYYYCYYYYSFSFQRKKTAPLISPNQNRDGNNSSDRCFIDVKRSKWRRRDNWTIHWRHPSRFSILTCSNLQQDRNVRWQFAQCRTTVDIHQQSRDEGSRTVLKHPSEPEFHLKTLWKMITDLSAILKQSCKK